MDLTGGAIGGWCHLGAFDVSIIYLQKGRSIDTP
jgi:hypothetical protein